MSLLKGILPDSWILKLFTPNEDEDTNTKIFLNLTQNDNVLTLKQDITRYTVIEFLKQLHNNYDELKDNITLLLEEYFEDVSSGTLHLLQPFMKEEIVFMNNTEIEIEHNKNDEGLWITDIYKVHSKNKKVKLATLAAKVIEEQNFSIDDIQNVD